MQFDQRTEFKSTQFLGKSLIKTIEIQKIQLNASFPCLFGALSNWCTQASINAREIVDVCMRHVGNIVLEPNLEKQKI